MCPTITQICFRSQDKLLQVGRLIGIRRATQRLTEVNPLLVPGIDSIGD